MAKVYVCTGGCNGVSEMEKACGAVDYPHYNQPLEPREQCEHCVKKIMEESLPCVCSSCKKT